MMRKTSDKTEKKKMMKKYHNVCYMPIGNLKWNSAPAIINISSGPVWDSRKKSICICYTEDENLKRKVTRKDRKTEYRKGKGLT